MDQTENRLPAKCKNCALCFLRKPVSSSGEFSSPGTEPESLNVIFPRMTLGIWNYNSFTVEKAKAGEGAPLTLADVFLGLGSGLGGAGFCKDKWSYTNTEKDNPQHQKKQQQDRQRQQSILTMMFISKEKNVLFSAPAKRPLHFMTIFFILGSQVDERWDPEVNSLFPGPEQLSGNTFKLLSDVSLFPFITAMQQEERLRPSAKWLCEFGSHRPSKQSRNPSTITGEAHLGMKRAAHEVFQNQFQILPPLMRVSNACLSLSFFLLFSSKASSRWTESPGHPDPGLPRVCY